MSHIALRRLLSLWMMLGLLLLPQMVRADRTAEAGRAVVTKWQHTVVTRKVVSKNSMSMLGGEMDKEERSECRGVVIDPSGLVVSSLMAVDPMSLLGEMMGEVPGLGDMKMESKSEITQREDHPL